MIVRLMVAIGGALIVTAALLLGMRAVTTLFERDTGERFYRIQDVLPKPEPGRPERPRAGRRQPGAVDLEAPGTSPVVPIEPPAEPEAGAPPLAEPEITPPSASDE